MGIFVLLVKGNPIMTRLSGLLDAALADPALTAALEAVGAPHLSISGPAALQPLAIAAIASGCSAAGPLIDRWGAPTASSAAVSAGSASAASSRPERRVMIGFPFTSSTKIPIPEIGRG